VNSLEGIADDLTALPFTLQDVKSEDGETPPPSIAAGPSRMSLHDVTRAFQQVPSSSGSAPHRPPISPPSTSAPVARPPPNYPSYSLPPPNQNMRPYGAYPSPLMSHSPSPAMMYPHPMSAAPVANRMPMNGHTPLYGQPVWMPLAGPATQNHGGIMRPAYPPQLVPYPSPGTPPVYAAQPAQPNMPSSSSQQNGIHPNRGHGMSSVPMPHQNVPTMYTSSPVLVHTGPVMQAHGYMPMPAGRGQMRNDNGHPPPIQSHPPMPSNSYSSVPPAAYRSTW